MPSIHHTVDLRSQWGPGFGLFVDLNCGWYCEIAAIRWWAAQLSLKMPDDPNDVLKHSRKSFGFSPKRKGSAFTSKEPKPKNVSKWVKLLRSCGPIIVGGKLGRADWGALGGVGHFVLIVGADTDEDVLEYRDPLQATNKKIEDFTHLNNRMNKNVFWVDARKVKQALEPLQHAS